MTTTRSKCSEKSCDRPADARGLCSRHYAAWYRKNSKASATSSVHAANATILATPIITCKAPGCVLPALAKGYCRTHYTREYRLRVGKVVNPTMSIEAPVREPLGEDFVGTPQFRVSLRCFQKAVSEATELGVTPWAMMRMVLEDWSREAETEAT